MFVLLSSNFKTGKVLSKSNRILDILQYYICDKASIRDTSICDTSICDKHIYKTTICYVDICSSWESLIKVLCVMYVRENTKNSLIKSNCRKT